MFALIDCNNFFVSCERIFQPVLDSKPVIVLSNNDGCVVSRSNEAKRLGIKMGQPYFECKDLINKTYVFSSNFELYGDISGRIMSIIKKIFTDIEIYSIDEAFVYFKDKHKLCLRDIRTYIKKCTSIPVSIGVGQTKTLAKLASFLAKKTGVYIMDQNDILKSIDVSEVWGIGNNYTKFLKDRGKTTVYDLKISSDSWIKRNMGVGVLKTVYELRGVPCFALNKNIEPKKGILTSRSFKKPITEKIELEEKVSMFATRVGEKLRSQGSKASFINVYIRTNRFNKESYYSNVAKIELPIQTDYTPELIKYAKKGLSQIYRAGYSYKKIAVFVTGITNSMQMNIFESVRAYNKKTQLMKTVDKINKKYPIFYAASGIQPKLFMDKLNRSKRYTTRWDELKCIKI